MVSKRHRKDVVLLVDDDPRTRALLARRLTKLGFEVLVSESYEDGLAHFKAGFVDVVIADWDLAADQKKKGDALFDALRKRDWEVPLVLVSGKLTEDKQRAATLAHILRCGSAAYVERGQGYARIIDAARELLARRDIALTEMIHKLRNTQVSVPSTAGPVDAQALLADLLSDKQWKDATLAPLAKEFAEWETVRLKQRHS